MCQYVNCSQSAYSAVRDATAAIPHRRVRQHPRNPRRVSTLWLVECVTARPVVQLAVWSPTVVYAFTTPASESQIKEPNHEVYAPSLRAAVSIGAGPMIRSTLVLRVQLLPLLERPTQRAKVRPRLQPCRRRVYRNIRIQSVNAPPPHPRQSRNGRMGCSQGHERRE